MPELMLVQFISSLYAIFFCYSLFSITFLLIYCVGFFTFSDPPSFPVCTFNPLCSDLYTFMSQKYDNVFLILKGYDHNTLKVFDLTHFLLSILILFNIIVKFHFSKDTMMQI